MILLSCCATLKVTYDENGASGTAPTEQKAASGKNVPVAGKGELTNPGKTFGGWNTDPSGAGRSYDAGSNLPITENVTLYAQWITQSITRESIQAPQEETPEPGIYVGLLSFSNEVTELIKTTRTDRRTDSNFIDLDTAEDMIKQALSEKNYRLSANFGTALFYAVHKGMVDLFNTYEKEKLPKNIDEVYMITITDGYDNASADKLLQDDSFFPRGFRTTPEQRLNEAGYFAFIKQKLLETTIGGPHIQAYSFGLDIDRPDQLDLIASNPESGNNYVFLGNLNQVKADLTNITRKIVNKNKQMIFTATFSPPFNGTRLKFEIKEDYYIIGTVVYQNEDYRITDIESKPAGLYESGGENPVKERGQPKGSVSFDFTINLKNGEPFSEGMEGKLYRVNPDKPLLDTESQLIIQEKIKDRKSVVVYFLLDNSKSMDKNIDGIRKSILECIDILKQLNSNTPYRSEEDIIGEDDNTGETLRLSRSEEDNTIEPIQRPTPGETVNYLTVDECIRQWRRFIAAIQNNKQVKSFLQPSTFTGEPYVPFPDYFGNLNRLTRYSGTEKFFWVQIGLFGKGKETDANKLLTALAAFLPAGRWDRMEPKNDPQRYAVRIGPFKTRREADTVALRLRAIPI
ncbi:hypothetical protein AGMMS49991_06360 [Spirochaetia bacterium]|nr:hypothetical protein AGMMS49991_06360 [Spirochaetia bacterium]